MCGRYTLLTPPRELARRFLAGQRLASEPTVGDLSEHPRYNVGPGQDVPILRASRSAGGWVMEARRWGFAAPWVRLGTAGPRPINARSETVAEKPTFRHAFRRHRCLVPATGYYEWYRGPTGEGPMRRPHYFEVDEGEPFAIAGLYTPGRPDDGGTCLVLTTQPNAVQAPIHDRMPVIVPASAWETWLTTPPDRLDEVSALLRPWPAERMRQREVNAKVNDARYDGPDVLLGPDDPRTWGALWEGSRDEG